MDARPTPANTRDLPPTHRIHASVDLKKDGRVAALVQASFVLVSAVLIGLPLVADLPLGSGWSTPVTIAVTVTACLAYMAAHELTHGGALWVLTHVRPSFTVRLPYLTTGSPVYLNKATFITVALAPLLLWGLVLVLLLWTMPQDVLLTLYVLLVLNAAGSAGDVVQAIAAARVPTTALLRDSGTETTLYLAHA